MAQTTQIDNNAALAANTQAAQRASSSILPITIQTTENNLKSLILQSPNNNANNDVTIGNTASTGIQQEATGRAYVNSLFPNEIEFYACALELIDSNGTTIQFFSFPVMPSAINESFQNIASIKKTNSGVVVNKNDSFIPFNISISGDFGRRFRSLYGGNQGISSINGNSNFEFDGGFYNSNNDFPDNTNLFDTDNKTGYGSSKILEYILRKSLSSDSNGKPYNLYFYNLAFNSTYNVEVQNFTFSQTKDRNMIWSYSLSLRALSLATTTNNNVAASLSDLRTVSDLTNEAKQQSTSIENVDTSLINGLSPVEQILYGVSSTLNVTVNKYSSTNPKIANAIGNVLTLAKNQNTIFLATIGVNNGQQLQRYSALNQIISF